MERAYLLLLAAALVLLAGLPELVSSAPPPDVCDNLEEPVPECTTIGGRDLLFLLDASNSMNQAYLEGEMLNYISRLYCSFDRREPNQVGAIIFNENIVEAIPMSNYTREEWFDLVGELRFTGALTQSCCTPMAEVFNLAAEVFNRAGKNDFKISYIVTDGVPSNNNQGTGNANPDWTYKSGNNFSPSRYNAETVGLQALALKNLGVRITMIGVPDRSNRFPDVNYFSGLCPLRFNNLGEEDPNWAACTNNPTRYRYTVIRQRAGQAPLTSRFRNYEVTTNPADPKPNPIVSLPVEKNALLITDPFDTPSVINQTTNQICEDTFTPTFSPTRSPSVSPTTRYPTSSPTLSPTFTLSPTVTSFPTSSPTSSQPTGHPTMSAPTSSPTFNATVQADLTFILDRSRSMTFGSRVGKCLAALGAPPSGPSPCWELLLKYVVEQADRLVEKLGWADDFPEPGLGVRVQLIGFACANDQRTPKSFPFSDELNGNKAVSNREDLVAMVSALISIVPDGGTCPGVAIEQAVKYVERADPEVFPHQVAILVTDGVVYDTPFPLSAKDGLELYGVMRFAVAVDEPTPNPDVPDAEAIAIRESTMGGFVSPEFFPANFLDLAGDWDVLLTTVAKEITDAILKGGGFPPSIPRYTWCKWRRYKQCRSEGWRFGRCQWPKGAKKTKSWACEPRP